MTDGPTKPTRAASKGWLYKPDPDAVPLGEPWTYKAAGLSRLSVLMIAILFVWIAWVGVQEKVNWHGCRVAGCTPPASWAIGVPLVLGFLAIAFVSFSGYFVMVRSDGTTLWWRGILFRTFSLPLASIKDVTMEKTMQGSSSFTFNKLDGSSKRLFFMLGQGRVSPTHSSTRWAERVTKEAQLARQRQAR
jgi:hypothetical protein